VANETEIRTS